MNCQYRVSGLCVDKQAPTFGQICNPRACGMENNYYFIMGHRVEVYRAALDKYGEEAQTRMVYEEMAELQKELCKHARGKDNLDAIAEEIADVEIMLEQMVLLHDCAELVERHKVGKLRRLANKIGFEL